MHRYIYTFLWWLYRRRFETTDISWAGAGRLIDYDTIRNQFFYHGTWDKLWVLGEGGEEIYKVTFRLTYPVCECADYRLGKNFMCKHVLAALAWRRWGA